LTETLNPYLHIFLFSGGIMRKFLQRNSSSFLLLLAALLATALLWGCGGGSDSYDTPTTATNAPIAGATTNVLIEPATLAGWMGQGLVNNQSNFDQNVVILDYASATDTSPRIRGAHRVPQGDLQLKRLEGVGDANPMVATGAQMDAVIQRLGIDEDTIIVITGSGFFPTRAYWTFRYWGFPKERLKVLNGYNSAFTAEYPELMNTEEPNVAPSTYSVRNLAGINADLRASVGEMIGIVSTLPSSTTNLVLDARGVDPASGKCGYYGTSVTPGQIVSGSVVVFDGHPEGGQYLNQSALFSNGKFKSAEEIKALFEAKGWAPGKKVTVYCTTGYSATPIFFALDTILDAPVQLFDGSWSVLGKYSQNSLVGGQLPIGSAWAVDKYLDPATLKYNNNVSAGLKIEPLHGVLDSPPAPFIGDEVNPDANQIEVADQAAVGSTPSITIADPVVTATAGVLIAPSTLQSWMDAGLVNAPAGAERVVILDVTSAASYAAGHIPGAQLWDTAGQAVTRVEGPVEAVNMVIPAAKMNERIQALGIDQFTTIVLTSSQTSSFMPSRAYFTFRYYGWPKSRLKVLNGYNFVWEKSALTTTATDLADSTLTVQQIGNLQTDLRASLPELMDGIRDGRGIPVDFRGSQVAAAGSTPGVFNDDHNADGTASQAGDDADYVVFEGTMKGGKYYTYTNFQMDTAAGDYRFKPELVIRNELGAMGLNGSELIYSMCRTGMIASTGFFVLDGILGWPVMIYDGSWSQWGSLSANAAKGGQVSADWAVDNPTFMQVVNYNKDALKKVEPLNPDSAALLLKPSDPAANQIEKADAEYQKVPPASTGGTSGPPTAGGGSSGGGC
jgi:3-mercaptopyruvate sulfurtransferase SseA